MNTSGARHVKAMAATAALSLALVAGCGGSRVDHDRVVAVGNGYGPAAAEAAAAAAPVADAAQAPAVADSTATDTATGAAPVTDAATDTAAKPAAGATTTTATTPTKTDATKTTTGTTQAQGPAKPAAAAAPAKAALATCPAGLPPIVIGQTLASSGLVGAAIAGLRTGLAAWARDVNLRGGVQCHQIQLTQLDDGSDPARVSSNWNTLTKEKGAIAMVGGGVPIAIAALRSAAERDRIPVVGGDITAVDWVESPYMFPTGGAPLTSYDGGLIEAAAATKGPVKTGIFYCVEASICTALKNNFPQSTKRAGAEQGPTQAVSLTQPDFTSECQKMKAAGVNVIFFGLDGSASIRAARSCASLNYFPTIATGAIAVSAQAAADQGLRRNNTYLGSGVVPYTNTTVPAVGAFLTAMERFAASSAPDQQAMLGWAAGKLFEAALGKVSDKARAGKVTTQMVLDGLWQLKNEKLGGLSPGATFTKGEPAKLIDCYYPLKLDEKGFSAPKGAKPVCISGDKVQSSVSGAKATVAGANLVAYSRSQGRRR
jgi:branched-chain amino acid transport system substrate-binding protein